MKWVLAVAILLAAGPSAADQSGLEEVVDEAIHVASSIDPSNPQEPVLPDPAALLDPVSPAPSPNPPQEPAPEPDQPGFADRVAAALSHDLVVAGLAGVGLALLGVGAFALVGRYVDPKLALENPQRSMLYGFIRGNPGVHLKKLSEEFGLKTSSILWHMRKLEAAQLVRSDRSNSYRVFYPVEGGLEVKKVSRAIANLRNANARSVFSYVLDHPGQAPADVARRLDMHAGTTRWHLRHMRDAGLVEELVRDDGSRFFPTDLGRKALEAAQGSPVERRTVRTVRLPTETPS